MTRLIASLLIGLLATCARGQTPSGDPPQPQQPPTVQPAKPQTAARTSRVSAVAMLRARLPQITFDETPLANAFAQLAEVTGTSIVVRWKWLEDAGVERERPVSLKAHNLRLSQVLWLIMNEVSGPDAELAYRADHDTITISTVGDFGRQMIIRTYDVRDLIAPKLQSAMLWVGREREVPLGANISVAEGAVAVQPIVGRIGSGVFFGGEGDLDRAELEGEMDGTREEHLRRLINIIVTTVEPDSWLANGGRGTISAYRGRLVVRNSPFVHQQIAGYLTEQRSP